MKQVLEKVMVSGTAMKSHSRLYRLAGKTATGYGHTRIAHDSLAGDSNMASFVGFGPVENPRVVVYVGVENPTDGQGVHGAYHAAPVFREVAEKTLQYLKVATN
jgi:cell division protein FtsI/penicillin-binding protein 2